MIPSKKLNPLLTQTKFRERVINTSANPFSQVIGSLKKLTDQLENIFDGSSQFKGANNVQRMQQRFQQIIQQVPQLPPLSQQTAQQRKYRIQKWLGKLCQSVFSTTFSMFQYQKLNQRKTKSYCCQNMLLNILTLIQSQSLSISQIAHIQKSLKQQLIPYFLIKYPMSEQAEVNLEFAKKVLEYDSMGNNQNDLVYRSGIQFGYRPDGNYNRDIMRFINYVIELPNQRQQGGKRLYREFYQDMQEFFAKVEDEKFTMVMNRYDPRNEDIQTDLLEFVAGNDAKQEESMEQQKQKEKYREAVKSYTKKLIGRKISQNVKPFSQLQIQQGQLKVTHPAVMRIITKWCVQLMQNFNIQQNILNKQDQFRMKDGCQKILKRKHLLLLAQLLKRSKSKVHTYLSLVSQNSHKNQHNLLSTPIPQSLHKFSMSQSSVGLFSASLIRNYQTYLVGYVNTIIHALMCATKDYQQMVKAYEYKQDQYGEYIDKWRRGVIGFEDLVERAYSYRLASVPVSYISLVPQLIAFRVGDIMRCRCTSKEKEIIALYGELERISRKGGGELKIVKIKNRLDKGTKDILINILYKNKMVVEMQLAVTTTRTKFIDFSNKFNHVLYQLRRAEFGPISQMCNIWINNDIKSQFYIQKSKQLNKRNPTALAHMCKGKSLQFPFKCSCCSYFYNDCNYILPHIECGDKKCSKTLCSLCQAENFTYGDLVKKFKEMPTRDMLGMADGEKYWEYKKRIAREKEEKHGDEKGKGEYVMGVSNSGYVIDLKGEDLRPKLCRIIKIGKKVTVIWVRDVQKMDMSVLKELETKDKLNQFKNQYLFFCSDKIDNLIQPIQQGEILYKFLTEHTFPKFAKKWSQKQKPTIVFMNAGLEDHNIKGIQQKFPYLKKLCFYNNNLKDYQQILQKFYHAQILDLGENNIETLDNKKQLPSNVKVLYLNYNKISSITPQFISKITHIQQIQLANNKLASLPNNFGSLSNCHILNLSRNLFSKLPKEVTQLKSLQVLNLYSSHNYETKLMELNEELGNLANLRKLNVNFNMIKRLPESIGKLGKLEVLYAVDNCLDCLPATFSQLGRLKILNLASNKFGDIPSEIGSLVQLEILNLEKSSTVEKQVKELPDSFCNLTKIKMMDISQNKITKLPQRIGNLQMLETLFIYQNRIKQIPESIGELSMLRQIYASNNLLQKLPDSFCKLKNLQKLTLKQNNKLKQLPANFGQLKKLKFLICHNNTSLSRLPQSIGELLQLEQLLINNTKITNLPSSINILKKLKKFQVDMELLDKQSQRIAQSLKYIQQQYQQN